MSSQSNANFLQNHILKRFTIIKKIGSGAYGHVWKVQQKEKKKPFALKKIFDAFQHSTDAQRTYRQIQILLQMDHPNIIKLHQTIRAQNNKDVYLLFEYMQADLHNVIAQGILKDIHIRFVIYQVAIALKYIHSAKLIHRDLKPSNVLLNSNCMAKICDFGLVRSLSINQQMPVLTEGVATRWYRAPQLLLGSKTYSTPADIWSLGCIIYEILAQKPLFAGSCTIDQIEKICSFTGYPNQQDIHSLESEVSHSLIKEVKVPNSSSPSTYLKDIHPSYANLLQKMIVFNPKKRITIEAILSHEIVREFHKPEQEITCERLITTSVDDNKKLTVDEYRRLVYGMSTGEHRIEQKVKVLSSSLGAGSVSPKYQPTAVSKSIITFTSNKLEKTPEMVKKFSYDRVKPHLNYEDTKKPIEKPFPKFNSTINPIKPHFTPFQLKKESINYDIPNREQTDPIQHENKAVTFSNYAPRYIHTNTHPFTHTHVNKVESAKFIQSMGYSAYGSNQANSNNSSISSNHIISPNNSINSMTSNNIMSNGVGHSYPVSHSSSYGNMGSLSSQEIKEKVLQFRSTKYPIVHKGTELSKGNSYDL